MPRVTHVKSAQQRYETKPVRDANGDQVVLPILKKDGTPKTKKNGTAIVRRVTEKDLTKPLPNETCGKCGVEIKPGDPYKHMKIKTGTYTSRRLVRCKACPSWHVWEYRYTRSARAAEIEHDVSGALSEAATLDDMKSCMEDAAGRIEELAEEADEGANNIEEGFGHPTAQSEELQSEAEELRSWAEECNEWEPNDSDIDTTCPDCDGTCKIDNPEYDPDDDSKGEEEIDCPTCKGTGEVDTDEPTEEQLDEWRGEASDVLGNCPI